MFVSHAERTPDWFHHGYSVLYHSGEPNHCPGCGKQQWLIGRMMAECAFCETALPLEHARGGWRASN